jgi:hypothetical protein
MQSGREHAEREGETGVVHGTECTGEMEGAVYREAAG